MEASLGGVVPVLATPFDENGSVDHAGFARVVDHVSQTGVNAVMFPGFASEAHKLDDAERRGLRQILVETTPSKPGFSVIISVGDHATQVATRRAFEAVEAGAAAINLLPPFLLSPSPAQVIEHLLAVAEAVAPTPVIVQYAPGQTGSTIDPQELSRAAHDSPNLRMVKVEGVMASRFVEKLASQTPPLRSTVGYAGLHLMDALTRGAVGTQPGCSFTEIYVELWRLRDGGDELGAAALHRRLVPYLSEWMQSVEFVIAAEKLILRRRGLIANEHCRAPCHRLDRRDVALIDSFLDEFGDMLP